jgi:histidine triad (HIT) family protein
MFSHQPENYICPFCNLLAGKETASNQKQDIVYQNEFATAFIAPAWKDKNPGHVLVVPNEHYENIYDIPDEAIAETYKVVKKIAIAVRTTYGCEGTSTRQHNEPAGNQLVWHFHVHVFPRYNEDNLYDSSDMHFADAAMRVGYADILRTYFAQHAD